MGVVMLVLHVLDCAAVACEVTFPVPSVLQNIGKQPRVSTAVTWHDNDFQDEFTTPRSVPDLGMPFIDG